MPQAAQTLEEVSTRDIHSAIGDGLDFDVNEVFRALYDEELSNPTNLQTTMGRTRLKGRGSQNFSTKFGDLERAKSDPWLLMP